MRAHELSEEPLAVPVAIRPRRVEEVAAEGHGAPQGLARLVVIGARPAAHPPHAVADVAHEPAEPSEAPEVHWNSALLAATQS